MKKQQPILVGVLHNGLKHLQLYWEAKFESIWNCRFLKKATSNSCLVLAQCLEIILVQKKVCARKIEQIHWMFQRKRTRHTNALETLIWHLYSSLSLFSLRKGPLQWLQVVQTEGSRFFRVHWNEDLFTQPISGFQLATKCDFGEGSRQFILILQVCFWI